MVITGLEEPDRSVIVDNNVGRTQLIAFPVVAASRP